MSTTKPIQQTVNFNNLYGPFLYFYVAKILGFTPTISKVGNTHICLFERKGAFKQFHPMNSPHLNKLISDFKVSTIYNESEESSKQWTATIDDKDQQWSAQGFKFELAILRVICIKHYGTAVIETTSFNVESV